VIIKEKEKLRLIGINLFLFAILFGIISFNKDVLRPNYGQFPFWDIILGSLPNFVAAYLISLAFVNGLVWKKPKHARLIVYSSSFVVFLILTAEEIKPMWGASTSYDIFDILVSFVGAVLSVFTFELIVWAQKRHPKAQVRFGAARPLCVR
jgi:uncharacterized membrane protein YeaQ/YmgE (transglycosylase-associated protein family)